jgi:hypothetical protein
MLRAKWGLFGMTLHAPLKTIPAISLWQPYATLIDVGAKRFETRHWPAPDRFIGKWVAIHAAARKITRAELDDFYADDLVGDALGFCHWHLRIPYGAVVCIAKLSACWRVLEYELVNGILLEDCRKPNQRKHIDDDGFGDYSPGRYCWELSQVRSLAAAVPARGAQGWWEWTVPQDAATQSDGDLT